MVVHFIVTDLGLGHGLGVMLQISVIVLLKFLHYAQVYSFCAAPVIIIIIDSMFTF